MMDLNTISIICSVTIVLWYLVKPIREDLIAARKDVKQNAERIAKIEGIIWTDINKVLKAKKTGG